MGQALHQEHCVLSINLNLRGGNYSAFSITHVIGGKKELGGASSKNMVFPKSHTVKELAVTKTLFPICHPVTASSPTQIHFRAMLILGSSVYVFPHSTFVTWVVRTEGWCSPLRSESVFCNQHFTKPREHSLVIWPTSHPHPPQPLPSTLEDHPYSRAAQQ